jgi:hypothetical protein
MELVPRWVLHTRWPGRTSETLRKMRTLTALAAIAVSGWGMPAQATATAHRRCATVGHAVVGVRGSRVIVVTRHLIVYRTTAANASGQPVDTWSACARGTSGPAQVIGEDERRYENENAYPPEAALYDLHLAGTWVFVVEERGAGFSASCGKYSPFPATECSPPEEVLLIANARRHMRTQLRLTVDDHRGIHLIASATGVIAWLVPKSSAGAGAGSPAHGLAELYACHARTLSGHRLTCRPEKLAQGQIASGSVHVGSTRVEWTNAARRESAQLSAL